MTGEPKGPTDAWIEKHNAKFAYGYSSEFIRKMEISGYPTAMVVSPAGEVLYKGSPSGVTEKLIEEHLDSALKVPAWEWPKKASATKKALLKGNIAKAVKAAEPLAQDGVDHGTEILAAVKALAAGQAKSISAAAERGDFLTVTELGKRLKKSLKGLPEMEQVNAAVATTKSSKAKKVIKAQKKIRQILEDVAGTRSRKKIEDAVKSLKKIADKNDDNYAGVEANKRLERFEGMLRR